MGGGGGDFTVGFVVKFGFKTGGTELPSAGCTDSGGTELGWIKDLRGDMVWTDSSQTLERLGSQTPFLSLLGATGCFLSSLDVEDMVTKLIIGTG